MTAKSLFKTPPVRKPYTPTGGYLKKVVNKSPAGPFMNEPNLNKRAELRCELTKALATIAALQLVNNVRNQSQVK